jgi:hypothetical protein
LCTGIICLHAIASDRLQVSVESDPAIDEALQAFMAKKKAAVPDSNV